MTTFWIRARRYPPILCRLLARTSGRSPRPLTDAEIGERMGGFPASMVPVLAKDIDWDGWSLDRMRAYLAACGVDFCSLPQMRRQEGYIRKHGISNLSYLRESPDWIKIYKPLYDKWRQHMEKYGVQKKA